jgi:hypothetical protein
LQVTLDGLGVDWKILLFCSGRIVLWFIMSKAKKAEEAKKKKEYYSKKEKKAAEVKKK